MKVVITGNYGAGNIGDEMILRGLIDMIRGLDKEIKITILSGNPAKTSGIYNVDALPKFPAGVRSFFRTLFKKKNATKKAVEECDYFVLGGGALFGNLNYKSYIIWGIQAFWAYFLKKPVIILGQSIDPLETRFSRFIVKQVFKRAKLIAVRDRQSKYELRKIKIEGEIYTIPDFALRSNYKRGTKKRKKELIIGLRQMDTIRESFVMNIIVFLNTLLKKTDWKLKFINFQTGKYDSDSKIHHKIITGLEKKSRIDYIQKIEDPHKLVKQLSSAKIVLGMRLHSIIAAIKAETPFIAISYAPKVEAFLKSAGMDRNILGMNNVGLANLQNEFKNVEYHYKTLETKLRKFKKISGIKMKEFEENVLKKVMI